MTDKKQARSTALVPHSGAGWPSPSDFSAYAAAAAAAPVLDQEEERRLVGLWRAHHDRMAAWKLVESHLRLVVRVVRDHAGYGLPSSDLAQEGTVGLMLAIARFNPSRGVRLSMYALRWIQAQVREFIFRNWRLVRLGTGAGMRRLFFGYRRTVAALRRMGDQDRPVMVMPSQIASALGVSIADVHAAQGYMRGTDLPLALPAPAQTAQSERQDVATDSIMPAQVQAWDTHASDPAILVETYDLTQARKRALSTAMRHLTPRQRQVLHWRLLSSPPMGLTQAGKRLGISAERVRQIEQAALRELRLRMGGAPTGQE